MSSKQGKIWIKISTFIVTSLVGIVIHYTTMVGWLFYIPSTARSFRDSPPFTVPCEGCEAQFFPTVPSRGSPLHYCCATQAPCATMWVFIWTKKIQLKGGGIKYFETLIWLCRVRHLSSLHFYLLARKISTVRTLALNWTNLHVHSTQIKLNGKVRLTIFIFGHSVSERLLRHRCNALSFCITLHSLSWGHMPKKDNILHIDMFYLTMICFYHLYVSYISDIYHYPSQKIEDSITSVTYSKWIGDVHDSISR